MPGSGRITVATSFAISSSARCRVASFHRAPASSASVLVIREGKFASPLKKSVASRTVPPFSKLTRNPAFTIACESCSRHETLKVSICSESFE